MPAHDEQCPPPLALPRFPGAAQHRKRVPARLARTMAVRRRPGIVTKSAFRMVPQRRTAVRRLRDTRAAYRWRYTHTRAGGRFIQISSDDSAVTPLKSVGIGGSTA